MAVDQAIGSAERTDSRYPLSFAQRLLWFMHHMTPHVPMFNICLATGLRGELDVDAMRSALDVIEARHEILRTTFESDGGVPWQVVHRPASRDLPITDLTGIEPDRRRREVDRLVLEEARRPFDLARGPMFRRSLLRCGPEEHVLTMVFHHIALDGWSVRLLLHELAELYGASLEGREPSLPELPIQFGDYAAAQQETMRDEVLEEHLDYWKEHLDGAPVLEIPLDGERPPTPTYVGATKMGLLPADLMEEVRRLARESRASTYMVLLAVFQVLMGHYSRQRDFVLGSALAGRMQEEVDQLIGCFVTVGMLRADLSDDPTFADLLERVKDVVLGATMYQEVPLERLIDELKVDRQADRNPLAQVVFAAQTGGIEWMDMHGLAVEPLHVAAAPLAMGTSRLDLTVSISERRTGEGDVWIEYSTDLFGDGRIDALLAHYERLLWQAVSQPQRRLSELDPIGPRERERLLEEWQGAAVAFPSDRCIHDLFEQQAARRPDAMALVCGDDRVTYGELDRRSNRLAHHLVELGVRPDAKVGLCVERSVEMVEGILAILKAGGAYLPLDPGYPSERLALLLERSGASVILTTAALADRLPGGDHAVVRLDADRASWSARPDRSPHVAVRPDNLACVYFTSGSQGEPKGIESPHRATVRTFFGTDFMDCDEQVVSLQMASMSWDGLTLELWPALLHGGTAVLLPERVPTPARLRQLIAGHGVNTMLLPTALCNAVVDEDVTALRGLRQLMVGGEAVSARHLRAARAALPGTRIVNCYGPAETTVLASSYDIPDRLPETPSVAIGRPIANTHVHVLDGDLRLVPTGAPGEVCIGGDGLARGYMGRPDQTAERFVPDPFGGPGARLYRTGDLARWRVDGTLEFLGRADEQVKVRGHRIEPGEVEAALARHPGVRASVVVARPDARGQKRLVAYVVPGGEGSAEREYRSHLRGSLPAYLVPDAFVLLDALPLTANGKVDRRALPEPPATRPGLDVAYAAPSGAVQEALARDVFGELLDVDRVGADDSFFDLGGNSIEMVQIVARVRERFGVELDLRQLYRSPTVATLAGLVEAGRPPAPARRSPVVTLHEGRGKAPLVCVHPSGGSVVCYLELAGRLGAERPFLALEADGLQGEAPPLERVEDMAARYLAALPDRGPRLLAGWSIGGLIAFEMACQLERAGQPPALLALIDTPSPAPADPPDDDELRRRFVRDLAAGAGVPPPALAGDLARTLRAAGLLSEDVSERVLEARLAVFAANVRAAYAYAPEPYDGALTLIRAAASPPADMAWEPFARGGVTVHVVAGDHHGILRPPHVDETAAVLRGCLAGAGR